jgi:hypothetical protein
VEHRRRDVAADAPSSGSRVSPLLVHHATPAAALHTADVLLCAFLPGPSVVKQRCFARGETQNAPPGFRAGGACRTAPVSGVDDDTLRRITSTVGPCAPADCIVRSVVRRDPLAWPVRLRFDDAHVASDHAHGRAPARGEPARAGMPWTVDSEVGAGRHGMEIGVWCCVSVMPLAVASCADRRS